MNLQEKLNKIQIQSKLTCSITKENSENIHTHTQAKLQNSKEIMILKKYRRKINNFLKK